jgi:hypothetical protein
MIQIFHIKEKMTGMEISKKEKVLEDNRITAFIEQIGCNCSFDYRLFSL